MFIVAIDGPAGSGKGTVAKEIAKKINGLYIDTGAMFRCVALQVLRKNVDIKDEEKIQKILDNIKINLKYEKEDLKVFLNDEDVSNEIRLEEVSKISSSVSALSIVREKLLYLQREMSKSQNIVMEGRDIGTVVFPNANVKIYLDATSEERAKRRFLQNKQKGINIEYEEVLEDIKIRDKRDMTRKIAPLKKAEDAVYIDSTNLKIKEVIEKILDVIKENNYEDFK